MTSISPDPWAPDENELEDIIADLPTLVALREFIGRLQRISWFKHVGEPLNSSERRWARAYVDSLGFPDAEIAAVGDWDVALDCARSLDWDTAAWEAEEQLRASLHTELATRMHEEALTVALTHVAAVVGTSLEQHMLDVGASWDIGDVDFLNAAAGAAAQAAHQMALAIAAGADEDYAFRHKFRLFDVGRWPIGIVGASFNLF